MNKTPNKRSPDPFEQAIKKSRGIFEIFKILEVKRSFIISDREVGLLVSDVEFP